MFKLCVFIVLFAVAAAAPGFVPQSPLLYNSPATTTIVHEPGYAKLGAYVKSVPTAVSHQSVSQVHSSQVVEPVVAPVVKTTSFAAPLLPTTYAAAAGPYVAAAPLVHTYGTHATW